MPDGMAPIVIMDPDEGLMIFENTHLMEMKTSPGNIAVSGPDGNYQIEGLFNGLRNWADQIGFPANHRPLITFVTTWDVTVGTPSVNALSNKYQVDYRQQLAWFYEADGHCYIGFDPDTNI